MIFFSIKSRSCYTFFISNFNIYWNRITSLYHSYFPPIQWYNCPILRYQPLSEGYISNIAQHIITSLILHPSHPSSSHGFSQKSKLLFRFQSFEVFSAALPAIDQTWLDVIARNLTNISTSRKLWLKGAPEKASKDWNKKSRLFSMTIHDSKMDERDVNDLVE